MKPEIIYVGDLAGLMATSEAAIRSHIQRKAWPCAIPRPFRIGRRWAWRLNDVKEWLEEKAMLHPSKGRKRGRPRKKESVIQG